MRSNYLYCMKIFLLLIFNNLILARAQRHSKVETLIASTVATIVGSESEQCTAADCNDRGSCFGTKAMPLCFCQIGFAGPRCLETYCDPTRECSAHGWCMGTTKQFTCFCNIGFSGNRCEKEEPMLTAFTLKPTESTQKEDMPYHNQRDDNNNIESFTTRNDNHESDRENENENEHIKRDEELNQINIDREARNPRNVNVV